MDSDDYGEKKKEDSKKEEPKKEVSKEEAEKQRRDIFFGSGDDNDLDVIEDLDILGGKDFENKNEDKFN